MCVEPVTGVRTAQQSTHDTSNRCRNNERNEARAPSAAHNDSLELNCQFKSRLIAAEGCGRSSDYTDRLYPTEIAVPSAGSGGTYWRNLAENADCSAPTKTPWQLARLTSPLFGG